MLGSIFKHIATQYITECTKVFENDIVDVIGNFKNKELILDLKGYFKDRNGAKLHGYIVHYNRCDMYDELLNKYLETYPSKTKKLSKWLCSKTSEYLMDQIETDKDLIDFLSYAKFEINKDEYRG